MIASRDDAHTVCGVTKSGRCKGCGKPPGDDFMVYPTTDISCVLCLGCIRGAVIAVAKEHARLNKKTGKKL